MKFLYSIIHVLNKPFPEQESAYGMLRISTIISAFVTFFLYIFQPFGISAIESNTFLICLGFGFITFITSIFFDLLVGRVLHLKGVLEQWTLGKWILYNLGVMLTISVANFLYSRIIIFGYIQWDLLPHMIYGTFMIGIIPICVLGGISILIQEKKFQGIAKRINQKQTIRDIALKTDDRRLFKIPVRQIKYVEALQNYVLVGYVDSNGQFKKMTERATLKNILDDLSGGAIVMSHRSFLVNKDAIISTSGNAQGLILQLTDCDRTIPVSRSYVAAFRSD